MDRSRSKRNHYYDHQDYDSRTRPRYNNNHHHYTSTNHRHRGNTGFSSNRQSKPQQDSSLMVTTTYRILCLDIKAGGVIGKSGSIIKSIRQHTGAWINVHELIPGDEERIIEISDTRRRDPDGRMPSFSPAQEALLLIHERILESDAQNGGGYGNEEEDYGGRGNRVVTRLVVSRMHVGCLMGKGGKIIEQMRNETKTHIRILPRDANLPRCVSMSEEIVQVVGDGNAVKKAVAIISSRLRESQHRDRSGHGNFHGRSHSPDRFFPDEDYIPHSGRRSHNYRNNGYSSRQSGYAYETGASMADNPQHYFGEDLVFRMLCPIEKVDKVVGEVDGIVDLLQNEIGVDVKVSDPVSGSDEQIIIISSEEGPDDELFPAQEALLHIQTRIADLLADKDDFVKTKLVVSSSEIVCLEGRDGSLSDMSKLTGAKIQVLPREELPACLSGADELVQIEGEIRAAREALVEVTSRLRSYLYREYFEKDTSAPISTPRNGGKAMRLESASPKSATPARDGHSGSEPPISTSQNMQSATATPPAKDAGGSSTAKAKENGSERREDVAPPVNRIPVPLVTRSILEIVIPKHAVPKLVTRSKNKLAQISELSGANITLVEDGQDTTEKTIRISGTPEQAERAQSLLQGFILSTQEDEP